MVRQRAPEYKDRVMAKCKDCEGSGVNEDHSPHSSALSNCCEGCNGLGEVDTKLGPLPCEQIIERLRMVANHYKGTAIKNSRLLNRINIVFSELHEHAHRPDPAQLEFTNAQKAKSMNAIDRRIKE